ncbi:hypothetical protein GRI62_04655 [Erythrobacter arachoides]|uniref:TonB C-terminal domain-containing protein n=1 Tax=Aurantiacibacter arachoides TaxID=1850444 RepID=A0A845A192_9SPHN|nr:energy transducer TonB [Aurantiacibacter arachoides]MXO92896.1 hypothetical protein [Aurantiacibacter arachoides]GGD53626.1 hypothetical protein GCM10011411_11900 [Aurantiacibacter arachoides]
MLAAAAMYVSPAAAQDSVIGQLSLQPSTPWNVDYAQNSCAIMRGFGPDDQRVLFELRQFVPGGPYRLMVASEHLGSARGDPVVTMTPGETRPLSDARRLRANGMRGVAATLRTSSEPALPDETGELVQVEDAINVEATRAMTFHDTFDRDVALALGDLAPAMEAMRVCLDDLVTELGFDPTALRNVAQAAAPLDQARWAREVSQHFPTAALRAGRDARITASTIVNPQGRIVRCAATNALGDEDFEAVACAAMMEYARLTPALDTAGEPTFGSYTVTIVYTVS